MADSFAGGSGGEPQPGPPEAGFTFQPQFVAAGAAVVLVVWYLFCRRRGGGGEEDYEVDDTGRKRKIMHGNL